MNGILKGNSMRLTEQKIISKCPSCFSTKLEKKLCLECGFKLEDSNNYQIPVELLWYSKEIDKVFKKTFTKKTKE